MTLLTLAKTAQEIGVSKRWFQYWIAEHPVDQAGIPFYIPVGRNKRFEPSDIGRIKAAIREAERCRLSSIGVAKSGIIPEQLARAAVAKVFGIVPATRQTKTSQRAKFPRLKPPTGKVTSMDPRQS